jgi:hypothetical protein
MSDYFARIDSVLMQQQMPPEYDRFVSLILCNDCEKRSYAKFHFLYHKCAHCDSYNTKVLNTLQRDEMDKNIPESTITNQRRRNSQLHSDDDDEEEEEDDDEDEDVEDDSEFDDESELDEDSQYTTDEDVEDTLEADSPANTNTSSSNPPANQ